MKKCQYKGQFKNNELCGEGVYNWKDKRVYTGGWKANKMNG